MKEKIILGMIVAIFSISSFALASWDVSQVTISMNNGIRENLISGSYQVTNQTDTNGDIVQVNEFVPDGGTYVDSINAQQAQVVLSGLIQNGFPLATTITNAVTKGNINTAGVQGLDTTYFDLTTNSSTNGVQ